MPRPPVPAEVDAFLARPNPAVVASVRPDGSPHTAATWYDWEDGRVLLSMDHTRLRLGYVHREPRISLTVLDGDDWHRQVTLLGRIVSIEEDEALADIDRLSRRYRGRPYPVRDSQRFSAWMAPESWYAWPPRS